MAFRIPQFPAFPTALVPRGASVIAVVTGFIVIAGWIWDHYGFKRLAPGLVSMNPVTALGFILAGVSLWLLSGFSAAGNSTVPLFRQQCGRVCALLVFAIGTLKLAGVFWGWEFAIDQLLFTGKLIEDDPSFPNRMAPNTALNFVLLGSGLSLIDLRVRRGWHPAEIFALATALISLLALIGYAYRVALLYGVATFIPMALHTAGAFHLLALGILYARPHRGLMAVVTGDSPGGLMARRLLPCTVLTLVVLGWLRLEGERREFYGAQFGVSLYTVVTIVMFGALIWWNARDLHHADAGVKAAESALRHAHDELEMRVSERTAALAAAEARFRTLVEQSLVGIYAIQDGRFVYVNPKMAEIFGFTCEELMSRPVTHFILEDDRPLALENIRKRLDGVVPHIRYNLRMVRKNGTTIHAEVHGALSEYNGSPGILGTLLDVTEQKRTAGELIMLHAELEQRVRDRTVQLEEANRELEAFSYSVSHDLRAPLRHIQGYADMLATVVNGHLPDKARRYLQTINEASAEMGQLIDDLLDFSRMGRIELHESVTSPDELARDAIEGLAMATRGRNIVWKTAPLPQVYGDPSMLKQVFSNLIGNAVKYTRGREPAEIETGCAGNEDGRVIFYVRDNGAGFDMQYAHKLFGVFQRLHRADEFEGTGIGLASVRRIIARHGGRTWAEGKAGQGATFYFTLKPGTAA